MFRRGHDDLGDHYLDCGDLSNALKCYSRARDYCTSAKHVINMCLNVIKVSLLTSSPFFYVLIDPLMLIFFFILNINYVCEPVFTRGHSHFMTVSLQVSVYLQNWSHVLSYVSKAESTPEIAEVGESCRSYEL